jgi:hypothetical protein
VLQAKSTAKEIEKGGEIAVIKDAGDIFSIGSHVNRALFSPEGSSEVYGNASHRDRAGDAPHPVDRRDVSETRRYIVKIFKGGALTLEGSYLGGIKIRRDEPGVVTIFLTRKRTDGQIIILRRAFRFLPLFENITRDETIDQIQRCGWRDPTKEDETDKNTCTISSNPPVDKVNTCGCF